MVCDEPVSDFGDLLSLSCVVGLNHYVALRVGAHRAIVDVGGADTQQLVVDHHDLGMNHGVGGLAPALHMGEQQFDAVLQACFGECAHEPDAAVSHGASFHPALVVLGSDKQDLQLRPFPHAIDKSFGDKAGGKKLVLDVDGVLGRVDRVEEQSFDLPHFGGILHKGMRARNADVDVLKIGRHARPATRHAGHGTTPPHRQKLHAASDLQRCRKGHAQHRHPPSPARRGTGGRVCRPGRRASDW